MEIDLLQYFQMKVGELFLDIQKERKQADWSDAVYRARYKSARRKISKIKRLYNEVRDEVITDQEAIALYLTHFPNDTKILLFIRTKYE